MVDLGKGIKEDLRSTSLPVRKKEDGNVHHHLQSKTGPELDFAVEKHSSLSRVKSLREYAADWEGLRVSDRGGQENMTLMGNRAYSWNTGREIVKGLREAIQRPGSLSRTLTPGTFFGLFQKRGVSAQYTAEAQLDLVGNTTRRRTGTTLELQDSRDHLSAGGLPERSPKKNKTPEADSSRRNLRKGRSPRCGSPQRKTDKFRAK